MNNIYLKKKYLKYKSKYLQLKNQVGGITPFCEKAYKNVLGTCWAVSVQTMITFSDFTSKDLKRVMESINLDLENSSFDDIKEQKKKFIHNRIQTVQKSTVLNSFYRLYNEYYPNYFYLGKRENLINILNKFIDRYYSKILEYSQKKFIPIPIEINDKTNPERCELVIAQNFKKLFSYSLLKYIKEEKYGGNIITKYLFFNLLSVFFLDYKVSFKTYYNNFDSINFNIEKDIGIFIHIEAHSCCLYICDGQQKYYNDWDKTVHNCDWIDLLKTSGNLYVEFGENLRIVDYSSYKNKHNLRKVLDLTVVSKHTIDSELDIEIKKIINLSEFNPSDFKDRILQKNLGHIFQNNDLGVKKNIVAAVQWYRLAAAQGDTEAMVQLAYILSIGIDDVAQDKVEAMQLYQLASENGDRNASLILANKFNDGDGVAKDKEEAVRLYRLSAEQTNATAQFKLANILLNDGNIQEATNWYENAALNGNIDALVKLGDMSFNGEGYEQSTHDAIFYYKQAATKGHVEAMLKLGDIYYSIGQKEEALSWYRNAANHKNADAQFKLGEMYYNGEVEQIDRSRFFRYSFFSMLSWDSKKTLAEHKLEAEKLYDLSAKQGNIEAQKKLDVINFNKQLELAKNGDVNSQMMVGYMFEKGKGVAQNEVEAVQWYQLAADKGNVYSQNKLGLMYLNSIGVAQDYNEAAKFFRLAADQGNLDAQYNLGLMFENGQGVAQNMKEAKRLYKIAAKQGHADAKNKLDVIIFNRELILAQQGNAEAEFNLGSMYEDGIGVTQNYAEAVQWYQLAATHGNALAQINLASMYINSRGVAQNYAEAVRLYQLAATQGNALAQVYLGLMYLQGKGVAQDNSEAMRLFKLVYLNGDIQALNVLMENVPIQPTTTIHRAATSVI
jgi:TPR repeat protein